MTAFGIGTAYVRGRVAAAVGELAEPDFSTPAQPVGDEQAAAAEPRSGPRPAWAGRCARGTGQDALRPVLDWVPVEVLGAYAALITSQGGGAAAGGTSAGWLALFCGLGALTTFVGATTTLRSLPSVPRGALGRGLAARAALCALAVFVWSWVLPGSATNRSAVGRHNGAAVVILVGVAAVVFGLLAQYLVELADAPRRPRTKQPEPGEPLILADLPLPPPVAVRVPAVAGGGVPVATSAGDGAPAPVAVNNSAPAPVTASRRRPVESAAADEGEARTRLLCASYLAATGIPDGPVPDSPTIAYLTDSASLKQSDPQVLSAWASGVRCLMVNTLGGVIVAFGAAMPEPGIDARRSVSDWVSAVDADLVVHRWFSGRVHAGFARELDRIWDRIEQQLRTRLAAAGPGAIVWMTGHGMGGGLANLAAARFAAGSIANPRVRTFGGARPGDGEFAKSYARLVPDSLRQEYGNDLVPHLPLGTEFAGRLGNLEFIEQLGVYLHRDFQPVGALRYTAVDGTVTGASEPLNLHRHRCLASLITGGNFATLVTDHDGRPGGGYFRALHQETAAVCATPVESSVEQPEPRGRARRWPRWERKTSQLQAADEESPAAAAAGG